MQYNIQAHKARLLSPQQQARRARRLENREARRIERQAAVERRAAARQAEAEREQKDGAASSLESAPTEPIIESTVPVVRKDDRATSSVVLRPARAVKTKPPPKELGRVTWPQLSAIYGRSAPQSWAPSFRLLDLEQPAPTDLLHVPPSKRAAGLILQAIAEAAARHDSDKARRMKAFFLPFCNRKKRFFLRFSRRQVRRLRPLKRLFKQLRGGGRVEAEQQGEAALSAAAGM